MNLLFLTISFIVGLYFFRNNLVFSIIITLGYLIFIFFRFKKAKKLILFNVVLLSCGLFLGNFRITYNSPNNEYSGIVVESKDNYFIFQSHFEKFYVYEKDNDREIGDYITIYSKPSTFECTTYESQFNFKEYLANKGVYRQLSSKEITIKFSTIIRLKKVRNNFLSKFDENASKVVDSFLFNNKDYSNELIQKANQLNLVYLLSLSGVYLHFLMMVMEKLLSLKFKENTSKLISILFITPYLIFTFPKIGVVRVFITSLFTIINRCILKKKYSSITVTTASLIFLLIIDYHLAFNSGFIVGYSLSFVLKILNTSLYSIKKSSKRIITPILIYLFLLPISTFSSGEFHLFTFFYQILLMPFNLFYVICSILCFIRIPLYDFVNGYTNVLTSIYKAFDKADIVIPFGDFGILFVFMYYAIFLISIYLFESKRYFHLKFPTFAVISMLLIAIIPTKSLFVNAVYFINVGQGDSILIQNRNHSIMIDTGGNLNFDMAVETLIPFMHKKQITHIDALITTHDDFDHSGAAKSLMENFKVYNYLTKRESFPYSVGNLLIKNLNTYKGKDDNDNSLVLSLDFLGKKWLFMGDASVETEKHIISENKDLDCDILKIGHHGSKTSTCDEFLDKVTPEEAIISVGAKNIYKHPNKEILDKLEKRKITIRRTDVEGTITFC